MGAAPGLAAQARALRATARRDWRIMRRYPDVLIGAIVWPVLTPLVYVFEARAFTGHGSGKGFALPTDTTHLAVFLYLGWLVASWFALLLTETSAALGGQRIQGNLETVLLSPATRLTVLFGLAPLLIVVGLLSYGAVLLTLVLGFGVHIGPWSALAGAGLILLTGPVFAALAAALANTALFMRRTGGLVDIARAVTMAFCGFTAPALVLPGWANRIGGWLPPTWTVNALRDTVFGGPGSLDWLRLALTLLGAGVVIGALALGAFAAGERRARRTGSLGGL